MKSNKKSTKEKINMTQAEQKKFIEGFKENKVIIVCRGIAEEEIVNVAEALDEGGVRYMEVPFDQKDVASNVVTARKIKLVSDGMPLATLWREWHEKYPSVFSEDVAEDHMPEELLHENKDKCVRIPMRDSLRSLNLSNSVAIAVYEILRQKNFAGMQTEGQLTRFDWE